jgi:hypothetical protein
MARSILSRWKSASPTVAEILRSISGCCSWNLESRGSSHLDANEGATLIVNVRSPKEVVLLLTAR